VDDLKLEGNETVIKPEAHQASIETLGMLSKIITLADVPDLFKYV